MEWGYDSDRGRRALRRMNQMHGRFAIANDDFLYVLSTFIFEPIRWNARFGWRPMCEQERLAMFHFWREVGAHEYPRLPDDYADLRAVQRRVRSGTSATRRRTTASASPRATCS